MLEVVDSRQDLLDFVTDEVAAHEIGLAIDELAMALVGHSNARIPGPGVPAIDYSRNQHATAGLCQTPRELRGRWKTCRKTCRHLGCPIGVWDGDDLSPDRSLRL